MANGLAILGGGSSFPLLATDGSAAAPSYSFASDPNTGLYSVGADSMGVSVGGTLRLTLASAAITSTVPLVVPLGTGAAPGIQGAGGGAGGLWWIAANQACLGDASAYFRSGNLQLFFAVNGATGTGECPNQPADYGFRTPYSFNFASAFNVVSDLWLFRLAAASLRQGKAPSATPVAQVFTLGEASRPGTDVDIGGANGTIRPGLGTGAGTVSHLLLQSVTIAGAGSGAQTYATYIDIGSSVVLVEAIARLASAGQYTTGTGLYGFYATSTAFALASTMPFGWSSSTNAAAAAIDAGMARLAAAHLRIGLAPSATPIAQSLTIGEASRATTDTNVAGAGGTINSGNGTGNSLGSSLIFRTPTAIASSNVAQTMTTRLTLQEAAATLTTKLLFSADNLHDIGALGATRPKDLYLSGDVFIGGASAGGSLRFTTAQANGVGASVGTLTNAPSATNPTKWIPIDDAGTTRYVPAW